MARPDTQVGVGRTWHQDNACTAASKPVLLPAPLQLLQCIYKVYYTQHDQLLLPREADDVEQRTLLTDP